MRLTLSLKASLAGAFGLLAVIAAGQGAVSIVKLTQSPSDKGLRRG